MSEDLPFLIDKPLGATPLEALFVLREKLGLAEDVKLAYAGRLDPMASGLLVVLHGDLLKRQEEYWHLDKTYEASIVLGIESDSYDVLGLAELSQLGLPGEQEITASVQSLVGRLLLSVPMYSSYRHEGKPLFQWAREDGAVPAPVRRMAVSEIELRDIRKISLSDLAKTAIERCGMVKGDFRQEEIISHWQRLADSDGGIGLPMVDMAISCSSGTYIRSWAHELGRRLKTSGMLFSLKRTRVGPFSLDDPSVMRIS